MLGILNPTKLLFTIAVVAAIWYGFKWLGRAKADRDDEQKNTAQRTANGRKRATEPATEEMVKCRTCGDYVSAERAVSCGRESCPYKG